MRKAILVRLTFLALILLNACSDRSQFDEFQFNKVGIGDKLANNKPFAMFAVEGDASPQEVANQKLTKLIEGFGVQRNRLNKEVPDYPEYYGGAYISKEGNLTIYIFGDMQLGMQRVISAVGESKLEFKVADYSYAYLSDIMNQLNAFAAKNIKSAIVENISVFSLMDSENRIVMELKDIGETKINEFKASVLNSPAIIFKKSEGEPMFESSLQPGQSISSYLKVGSIGFRAKRISDGKEGVVTAGHVIRQAEAAFYENSNSIIIGGCYKTQIEGTIDAAFVTIFNPAYAASNLLWGTASDLLSVSTSQPGAGTVVNKIGYVTNHTSGVILSTNASWPAPLNNNIITDMTTATYTSAKGDSGGIVYTYISATGTRPTVGIHTGSQTVGSTKTAYFTKADNILTTFGLARY
ncbi:S1 family peptidase [Sphingobacterium sp. xlx-130]|uniref:S1 family peptidase n=1 Tax=Sphingobacterium sp. xlx-130 TaxID=2654323 RepID=UPI0013DBF484|nr:S1 family peptidase [Sphingobacterium sp. xlx-130]